MSFRYMLTIGVITLCCASSCSVEDEGPQNPIGWEIHDVVIADNVVVIDDGVETVVDASSITISSDAIAAVGEIQPGDIIVSGKGAGFLRRVESIGQSDGNTILHTTQAALADAILQGSIAGPIPLRFSDDPSYKDRFDLDFSGHVLYDNNNLTITLSSALLSFEPILEFALDYDLIPPGLKYFKAVAGGFLEGTLAIQANYDALDASFSETTLLWESAPYYYTVPVGIPIVLETTLALEAGFEVGFSSTVNAEAGASVGIELSGGAEYVDGAWHIIATAEPQLEAIGPTLEITADAGIRVFLRPKITTKAYGVAGVSFAVEPYGQLDVSFSPDPGWALSAGLLGNIDFRLEVFDHTIAEYQETLFDFNDWPPVASGELSLCNGNGVCDPPLENGTTCPEDCPVTCDPAALTGSVHDYIIQQFYFPMDQSEAQQNGGDVDGDGDIDNRLADINGAFWGWLGQDPNAESTAALSDGSMVYLTRITEEGPATDNMALHIVRGQPAGAPLFDGSDVRSVATGWPTDNWLCGSWTAPALTTPPGEVILPFPTVGLSPASWPEIPASHVRFETVPSLYPNSAMTAAGWTDVIVSGGLTEQMMYSIIVGIAAGLDTLVGQGGSTAATILDLYDGNCVADISGCTNAPSDPDCAADGSITSLEIKCNPLMNSVLAPDIDSDGDGVDDLTSFGYRIVSATPATIQGL